MPNAFRVTLSGGYFPGGTATAGGKIVFEYGLFSYAFQFLVRAFKGQEFPVINERLEFKKVTVTPSRYLGITAYTSGRPYARHVGHHHGWENKSCSGGLAASCM